MRDENRKYNFYFTHNPTLVAHIYKILEDGYIKRGKDLPQKYHITAGNDIKGHREVYGNIYFDNLMNRQEYWGNHFIINPNIVEKYDFGFRQGWQGHELVVNVSDNNKIFWKKMDIIHDYLKNVNMMVKWINGKIRKRELYNLHEVVFRKNISIKKYVTAITCDIMTDVEMERIKKIITEKKYNIKLIRRNHDDTMTDAQIKKIYKPLKTKELVG